ncbi:hypothetical protein AU377_10020 [Sporosarcina sp. HYO08]|nr:hypothetical protein AU377_10020 [Sporosarcina sp. HYO08]
MATIQQLRLARMHTIGRVKRIEDAKWDVLPGEFNNNIRWHVGHIYVTMETLIQQALPSYEVVHPEWIPFFIDGTSPGDWGDDAPTSDVLLAAIRDQLNRIPNFLEGKMVGDAAEPLVIGDDIMTIGNIDDIVQFIAWHEGVHAGVIDALGKVS